MSLKISIDWQDGPGSPQELRLLSKAALSKNLLGHHYFWDGTRFLLDATKLKTARPQADRLVSAWCCFSTALRYPQRPSSCAYMVSEAARALRNEMVRWLDELDGPREAQLEKAQTRKRTHEISARTVADIEAFRDVFDLTKRSAFEKLDATVFGEQWCVPAIERRLERWREQLAFIEMKLAEDTDNQTTK